MVDTEYNQHKMVIFQILTPYSIQSMTLEFPTHSLCLIARATMVESNEWAKGGRTRTSQPYTNIVKALLVMPTEKWAICC